MDLAAIGLLIVTIITFIVKHWADILAIRKAIRNLIDEIEKAKSDNNLTNEEKDAILNRVQLILEKVIPLFASVWKKNWKTKNAKQLFTDKK